MVGHGLSFMCWSGKNNDCVMGHVVTFLCIPLVVRQNCWEEVSLVVVLVQKFACEELVV